MPPQANPPKSVSGLLYDFFLSYRHLDNTVLSGAPADKAKGEKGWVDDLETFLCWRVRLYLQRETRPWLDTKNIRRSEKLTDEIRKGIRGSRLFLPVLSRNYLAPDSHFVPQEFDEFIRKAKRDLPEIRRNRRVFKILRAAVRLMKFPLRCAIPSALNFSTDPPTRLWMVCRLNRVGGNADQKAFLAIAEGLAREISDRLETIDRSMRPRLGALYLASHSDDIDAAWGMFRTEFKNAGYEVLPTAAPPLQPKAFDHFVSNHLERCRISVHLLGEEEGALLSDNTPAHHRDFELALERCRAGKLQMFCLGSNAASSRRDDKKLSSRPSRQSIWKHSSYSIKIFRTSSTRVGQRFKDVDAREKARSAAPVALEAEVEHQAFLLHDLVDHGEGHLPAIEQLLRENLRCGSLQPIFDREPASRRLFSRCVHRRGKNRDFLLGRQYTRGSRSAGSRTTGSAPSGG